MTYLVITIYRNDRNSSGGDVLLAVHPTTPPVIHFSPANLEIISVGFKCKTPLLLCVLYSIPNPDQDYFQNLLSYLSNILSSNQ